MESDLKPSVLPVPRVSDDKDSCEKKKGLAERKPHTELPRPRSNPGSKQQSGNQPRKTPPADHKPTLRITQSKHGGTKLTIAKLQQQQQQQQLRGRDITAHGNSGNKHESKGTTPSSSSKCYSANPMSATLRREPTPYPYGSDCSGLSYYTGYFFPFESQSDSNGKTVNFTFSINL